MMLRFYCSLIPLVLFTSSILADDRPNIIIMMSDDMGFSDIGCYGGEIQTPVLDSLAEQGVRFTQFYNTGRCCPTRAALLTGVYPHQAEIGHMVGGHHLNGYQGELSKNCLTIAEFLKTAGYSTYMSGKWHVTRNLHPKSDADKHNWPLQRGFDRFFGTIHGAGSFYDPNSLTLDNDYILPSEDFFYTDAISEYASEFIQEHDSTKPFFMYVTYTAAHWPMHARPHNIAKYQGVYDQGYQPIRQQRLRKMSELGLIDSRWEVSPLAGNWQETENYRDWEIRCMEVYAAMVDCMDQGIGQIVKALDETGQRENTLILFLQDNGGCAEGMGRQKSLTFKYDNADHKEPMKPGEFQTEMIPRITRDGKPMRQGRGVMPGPADTYIGYGRGWANVSNTPFREYKHYVHEGGISTPLIAHWPAGISNERYGKLESQPAHLIDLMATCVDLSDQEFLSQYQDLTIKPLEGISLVPAIRGQELARENPIFWEHEGNRALRQGDWKIVAKGAGGAWELYNIQEDRTEMNNLAASQPERMKSMVSEWEAWAKRANVIPWPWKVPYGEKPPVKKPKKKQKKSA